MYLGKDGKVLMKPERNVDHDSCPKCGNRMGFAFGTCVDCGFNYLDYDYKYIKVDVDKLPESIKWYLIDNHDRSVDFKNRL